jgi:hypothetical protein
VAAALSDVFYQRMSSLYDNLVNVVLWPIDENIFDTSSHIYQFEGEAIFLGIAPSDILEQEAVTLNQLDTLQDDWIVTDIRLATEGPLVPEDENSSAMGRMMIYGRGIPWLVTTFIILIL